MTAQEVMTELQAMGSESIKKILLKHGVKEPFFGVKVEHLKTIQKKTGKDAQLAKELYATGNADAMYLAGLITDDMLMTEADLNYWVQHAVSSNISEYTVPWVAAGSPYGYEMATQWIYSKEEHIAAAGWATLGSLVALKPDTELDLAALKKLLERAEQTIHSSPDRVKQTMNGFIAAAGIYVTALTETAMVTANKIGNVTIYNNSKLRNLAPATDTIQKATEKGNLGKKKKTVKC